MRNPDAQYLGFEVYDAYTMPDGIPIRCGTWVSARNAALRLQRETGGAWIYGERDSESPTELIAEYH